MSAEGRVSITVSISGGNAGKLNYQNNPTNFTFDSTLAVAAGLFPGGVLASVNPGTVIDLSKITSPGGVILIQNMDLVNFVTLGAYDPTDDTFHPIFEVLPGEIWPHRLSRVFGSKIAGTGTGILVNTDSLMLKADTGPVYCQVHAFNK